MNQRQIQRLGTPVLAAAGMLLTVLLVAHAPRDDGLDSRSAPVGKPIEESSPTASAAEFARHDKTLGTLEQYRAVIERPLFDASRRPPEPPASASATPSKPVAPPEYILDGVVITPEQRSAILRNKATSKVTRATEGMRLGDWTLKTLEADRVVLGHRETQREIVLRHFASTTPADASRSSQQRSPASGTLSATARPRPTPTDER